MKIEKTNLRDLNFGKEPPDEIQDNNSGLEKGFTYIELILYVAIVTIVLAAIVPFAWNVIGGSQKSNSQQEVYSQARFISERIKQEIRNSLNINSPLQGQTGNSLSLQVSDPLKNPTLFDINNGYIRLKQGAGSYYNLNSDRVKIISLIFINYSSADNKTKNIQFNFVIDDNYTGSRQEYKVPVVTIQSTAEIRSN